MKFLQNILSRSVSMTTQRFHIVKLTRMNIVDNSSIAINGMAYHRRPKVIHVYTKTGIGRVGDKILLAVSGQKQKALIVGCKGKLGDHRTASRIDANNCIIIDDDGIPIGSIINAPIPIELKKMDQVHEKVFKMTTAIF
ncbi:hypothetical protein SNEBB_009850 [Seison nebaliae]|nr:hypothetical protein SNEBB_009850 [Seison nebaliae]